MVLLFTQWVIRKERPLLKRAHDKRLEEAGKSLRDRLRKMILINWRNRLKVRKWNSRKTSANCYSAEGKAAVLRQTRAQLALEVQCNANGKWGKTGWFVDVWTRQDPQSHHWPRLWSNPGLKGTPQAAPALLPVPPFPMWKFSSRADRPSPWLDLAWNILFSKLDFNLSARCFGIAPTCACE